MRWLSRISAGVVAGAGDYAELAAVFADRICSGIGANGLEPAQTFQAAKPEANWHCRNHLFVDLFDLHSGDASLLLNSFAVRRENARR